MKGFLLFLMMAGASAALPRPSKRPGVGTGWRGKVSKWLPGFLGRRLTYDLTTGYDTTNNQCLTSSESCPSHKASVCTGFAAQATTMCAVGEASSEAAFNTARAELYAWGAQEANAGRAADTIFDIATGLSWNQWAVGQAEFGNCGSAGSCTDVYKEAILVYDEANCWPKSMAVPIMVNARGGIHDQQLTLCANTVKHMLGKKPLGAFVRSPVEQLAYIVKHQVLFTCGNTAMVNDAYDASKVQYPYIDQEGGGGQASNPTTYAESTGMCGAWNTALSSDFQIGGTRFGGTVTTEEYGHTIFDISIAEYDPKGWIAVQKAEAAAYARWVANNAVGHERDPDWDCHTASTEYFAAGVEMLLYSVRIGENHKATTRTELKTQDPELWCLALRHYELNNKYTPCPSGPTMSDVTQDVDCKAKLQALGVTTFGPDGSNGAMGGGAKTNAALTTASDATCPSDSMSCTEYSSSGPSPSPALSPGPSPSPAPSPSPGPSPSKGEASAARDRRTIGVNVCLGIVPFALAFLSS